MTWTELTKNTTRPIQVRGAVKVFRGNFGDYNTRGEIAEEVRGDASAEVTRKEMEDHFGTRDANSFTETSKNTANHSEVSKNTSNPNEVSKNSSNWSEI